jgi:hypothetical protein
MANTPLFAFRLSPADRESVVQMSKLYGSPNPSAFAREMLTAMCSGDRQRVADFTARLIRCVGEQLILSLNPPVASPAPSAVITARKKKRRRRGPS